jgi:hypothetical protein
MTSEELGEVDWGQFNVNRIDYTPPGIMTKTEIPDPAAGNVS